MTKPIVFRTSKKHIGKYVCFKDFNSFDVVSYDKDPLLAIAKAKKLGHKSPVILYVPKHDMIFLTEVV